MQLWSPHSDRHRRTSSGLDLSLPRLSAPDGQCIRGAVTVSQGSRPGAWAVEPVCLGWRCRHQMQVPLLPELWSHRLPCRRRAGRQHRHSRWSLRRTWFSGSSILGLRRAKARMDRPARGYRACLVGEHPIEPHRLASSMLGRGASYRAAPPCFEGGVAALDVVGLALLLGAGLVGIGVEDGSVSGPADIRKVYEPIRKAQSCANTPDGAAAFAQSLFITSQHHRTRHRRCGNPGTVSPT